MACHGEGGGRQRRGRGRRRRCDRVGRRRGEAGPLLPPFFYLSLSLRVRRLRGRRSRRASTGGAAPGSPPACGGGRSGGRSERATRRPARGPRHGRLPRARARAVARPAERGGARAGGAARWRPDRRSTAGQNRGAPSAPAMAPFLPIPCRARPSPSSSSATRCWDGARVLRGPPSMGSGAPRHAPDLASARRSGMIALVYRMAAGVLTV